MQSIQPTHTYLSKKGNNEFKAHLSLFLLVATLIVSLIQAVVTIHLMSV